jgi:hypothetical protein
MVAIPVSNPQDSKYKLAPGASDGFYDGVGYVSVAGGGIGTGALIGKQYLITAAHLFNTTPTTYSTKDGTIRFDLPGMPPVVATFVAANVKIYSTYNPSTVDDDLVIIKLDHIAPLNVDSYALYTQQNELGKQFVHVGYGIPGTGADGAMIESTKTPVFSDTAPVKRFGSNIYDITEGVAQRILTSDFDNGKEANNKIGGLGLGANEVTTTPGDSGGPNFIDGKIAGITSFYQNNGSSTDLRTDRGGSFGDTAGDTRVSMYVSWINDQITALKKTNVFNDYSSGAIDKYQLTAHLLAERPNFDVLLNTVSVQGAASQFSYYEAVNFGATRQLGYGVLLTTGDGTPPQSNTSSSYGINVGGGGDADLFKVLKPVFNGVNSTYDAASLSFSFKPAKGYNAVKFDVMFGSDEFPEYQDNYPDIGIVMVNGKNYAYFNDTPSQLLSIISTSINAGNFQSNGGFPIEYDGLSAKLTVIAPISGATNKVKIAIADTNDGIYDSGLWVSGFELLNAGLYGTRVYVSAGDDIGLDNVLTGTNVAEFLDGGDGDDILNAGGGNDLVMGGKGNDLLIGGSGEGNDSYDGGEGIDTVDFSSTTTGVVVNLAAKKNGASGSETGIDQLANIENVIGGSGNDKITGSKSNNVIEGKAGADILDGGAGIDTVSYKNSDAGVNVDLSLKTAQSGGHAQGDILKNFENVLGSDFDDTLAGSKAVNVLTGGLGNDTFVVTGTNGIGDTFDGGAGQDKLVAGGTKSISMSGFSTATTSIEIWQGNGQGVLGSKGADTFDFTGLTQITGLLFADGAGGNDTMIGRDDTDDVLRGGAGNDTIIGGGGDDTLTGGAGNDTFIFTAGFGHDKITDFKAGPKVVDVLQFDAGLFASFAEVMAAAAQVGKDTVITFDANNSITLEKVLMSKLVVDDFAFV